MAAVVVSVTGGCWFAGQRAQEVTSNWAEEVQDELKKKVKEDSDAHRNSQVGKAALATLFESVGKGEEENRQYLTKKIKIPPVEWHPGAISSKQKKDIADSSKNKNSDA